ncbi:hypothetical protein RMATCC62417_16219 [Rhizopus microsporus]|nr:hypothetical protein RMATCC62417_16219 [Rhizopus microsporus]
MIGFIELCTAYFFIGDHGNLAKEDVRAAYDGTLFYRLEDNSTVQRKQKTVRPLPPLAGSYLLSSQNRVIRFVKGGLHSLPSSVSITNAIVRGWAAYLQENTIAIKNNSIYRILKRSFSPMIQGVTAPKPEAIFSNKKNIIVEEEEKQDDAFSHLAGVVQPETSLEDSTSLLCGLCIDDFTSSNDDSAIFRNMTKKNEEIDIYVINSSDEGFMNGFLRTDNDTDWLQEGFTGIKKDDRLVEAVSEKMHDFTDDENKKHATENQEEDQQQQEDHAESSVEHVTIAERELVVEPTIEPTVKPTVKPTVESTVEPTIEPTVKPIIGYTVERIEEDEEIAITPPPDEASEKKDAPKATVITQEKKNPEPVQGKRTSNKKKKKKHNQAGHVSPITSDSGKD